MLDGSWMWLWGGLMMFVALALIAAVVGLITSRAGRHATPSTDPACDMLAQRYLSGEITARQYRQGVDALR